MASWATPAYAVALTGTTLTEHQLAMAQGVIDLFSNVTPAASGDVGPRDLRTLRAAVSYQAAWMAAQVDVLTRTDVSTVSQDGVQFTYAHPDAPLLAPLAHRALCRLSWMRTRSVSVGAPGRGGTGTRAVPGRDTRVIDRDGETWDPL